MKFLAAKMAESGENEKLQTVLNKIGLGALIERFRGERVDLNTVIAATDAELTRLGVVTIGDRARLRDICRKEVQQHAAAAGVQERSTTSTSIAPRRSYPDILRERASLFSSRGSRSRGGGNRRHVPSAASHRKKISRPWTVQFYCLSSKFAFKVPTQTEKEILHNAGLGLRKIKLDLSDDENEVRQKLTSSDVPEGGAFPVGYPQLKDCGGFELMQCLSNSRDLSVLCCSLAAKDIKAKVGGGQGKIFIRPIQKNLCTKKIIEDSKSSLKEKCMTCGTDIPLHELRSHITSCGGYASFSDSENASDDDVDDVLAVSAFEVALNTETGGQSPIEINMPPSEDEVPSTHHATNGHTASVLDPTPIEIPAVIENNVVISLEGSSTQGIQVTDAADELFSLEYPDLANVTQKVTEAANDIKARSFDQNPVEIVKYLQKKLLSGRVLDVEDPTISLDGKTNFIMVDRNNILETGFDEIGSLQDKFITLEVQFYNEVSV